MSTPIVPGVGLKEHKNVAGKIAAYDDLYSKQGTEEEVKERKSRTQELVNLYYDLATDFYEYGWGQSFHFAPRHANESHNESIVRHELWLAHKLGLKEGETCIDIGCGIGGPMRNIARFSGAKITGLNNNAYQLTRLEKLTKQQGLEKLCSGHKGNFMDIDLPAESFDKAYAIEATCHAQDRTKCFSEIFKILKPGGVFGGYEWVYTDKCDPNNKLHKEILHNIETGDGLPTTTHYTDVVQALKNAGFEVLEFADLAAEAEKRGNPIPWYDVMQGGWSIQKWKVSSAGVWCTDKLVRVLETVGLAPAGTTQTHTMLIKGKEGLVAGGELGIFTPMFFFLAVKPDGSGAKGKKNA